MKIAIDVSPLKKDHFLQHRVRGTGFYIKNLKMSLLTYFSQNKYIFYTRGEKISSEIDIVHIPYFEPFFFTIPIIKKYKTIVTVHDLTPLVFSKYFPSGIKGKIKWRIQKTALNNANAIITDSESSKKDIIKYAGIPDNKIHVVYLAAGEEFKKYQISNIKYQIFKKKYNLPDKFVLYVGDVTWNKNLPRLLDAITTLNIPLVMVGKTLVEKNFDKDNPWNQDLVKVHKIVEENKNIKYLGFIPTEDLVMLYNLAAVFAMPSLYEGFGLPVLEAMQCGCPVVTSKEGSLPEVAGDAAFYVDAYHINDIAYGIKKVFENKKIQENLSQKGLIQAKKFSWKMTANETIKVYKKTFLFSSSY